LKTHEWEFFETIGDIIDETFGAVLPENRQAHGCVQHPHQPSVVYVHGGASDGDGDVLGGSWRIDLNTLKWTYVRSLDLPYGVGYHSIATEPSVCAGKQSTRAIAEWIDSPCRLVVDY
jgi:hypothetical protein